MHHCKQQILLFSPMIGHKINLKHFNSNMNNAALICINFCFVKKCWIIFATSGLEKILNWNWNRDFKENYFFGATANNSDMCKGFYIIVFYLFIICF